MGLNKFYLFHSYFIYKLIVFITWINSLVVAIYKPLGLVMLLQYQLSGHLLEQPLPHLTTDIVWDSP